jgi:hypothetical protein
LANGAVITLAAAFKKIQRTALEKAATDAGAQVNIYFSRSGYWIETPIKKYGLDNVQVHVLKFASKWISLTGSQPFPNIPVLHVELARYMYHSLLLLSPVFFVLEIA